MVLCFHDPISQFTVRTNLFLIEVFDGCIEVQHEICVTLDEILFKLLLVLNLKLLLYGEHKLFDNFNGGRLRHVVLKASKFGHIFHLFSWGNGVILQ